MASVDTVGSRIKAGSPVELPKVDFLADTATSGRGPTTYCRAVRRGARPLLRLVECHGRQRPRPPPSLLSIKQLRASSGCSSEHQLDIDVAEA